MSNTTNIYSKYDWEYTEQGKKTTVTTDDGIPVVINIVPDYDFGFDFLMENYEFLVQQDFHSLEDDMTNLDAVDRLLEQGYITENEHMQAYAGGWHKISPYHGDPIMFDLWKSAEAFRKECNPNATFNEALQVVLDSIDRIEGWLNEEWHFVCVSGYVAVLDNNYDNTEFVGGYESYLFETGKDAKYGDEIIDEFVSERAFEYKTRGNWRQGLLDIA